MFAGQMKMMMAIGMVALLACPVRGGNTPSSQPAEPDPVLPSKDIPSSEKKEEKKMPSSGPDQVRVLHLLCKHQGSRNPVSRRTNKSTRDVSQQQAHDELKTWEKRFQQLSGEELVNVFAAVCKDLSDCGSFAKGGDLGAFGRGEMQKPFEEASFGLQVGQMSGIVDSDSGSHLILRIALDAQPRPEAVGGF